MSEFTLGTARNVSVVAATTISLACGTNYVYSAWGPQYAERLKLSSTQSNLIGTAGNLGMYASGIPFGLLVDAKGPRPGVLIGAVLLGIGYFLIHRGRHILQGIAPFQMLTACVAYNAGPGSMGVPLLCLFSFFTGCGSASAFTASIKTSALNWPDHRGTATAFPLAAFGLSAFFFSTISTFAFPDDTSKFLLMLAIGTFALVFVSFFFLRVIPYTAAYSTLPTHEPRGRSVSNPMHRTKSAESRFRRISEARGQHPSIFDSKSSAESTRVREAPEVPNTDTDETSSLMSKSSSSGPGDDAYGENSTKSDAALGPQHIDIRGLALLHRTEFWQLWSMLGLLTGIGLMTINNIGNDAQALWRHYDDSATPAFIQQRQIMHVSILSFCSFCGRLLSGVGSDLLVKKLNMSRFWCIFISACIFCAAQVCGTRIQNPHFLTAVSGLTGLAYGFLFGVYPSIIAHTFGVAGLSQNWGVMTLAPVISGNIFNILYGTVYDRHSMVLPGGERDCTEGLSCYRTAYWVTFGAAIVGVGVSLWSIWHEGVVLRRRGKEGREEHERDA